MMVKQLERRNRLETEAVIRRAVPRHTQPRQHTSHNRVTLTFDFLTSESMPAERPP